jgi:hypothetical protein
VSTGFLGYHIDLKRPMWTRSHLDSAVDLIRGWGFNFVLYEIEDKFRFSRHPAIVHPEAPSHEETADFARSCRAKGVEVIPMMQSLGHAECVVGKPEYAHLREAPEVEDQYDPLSGEARALILGLYDEIIEVMRPREFFHVGGDETFSLGMGLRSRPVVEKIGIGGLYLRHMLPILEHVHRRGLRPIVWADIVLSHPEILPEIPKYVVMMDWDYGIRAERGPGLHIHGGGAVDPRTGHRASIWGLSWADYPRYDNPAFREHFERFAVDDQTRRDGTFRQFYATDALRSAGLEVITASASRSCGDAVGVPDHDLHLPNCFHSARKGLGDGCGHLVTSWAVRHNHPELGHFAAFAAARAGSSGAAFDQRALGEAFTRDFYGAAIPEFAEAVRLAARPFPAGESRALLEARKCLERGDDPLPHLLEPLERKHGGRDGAAEHLRELRAGYAEARAMFERTRTAAVRNAHNLDFWLEGTDLQAVYADFALAALAGRLAGEAPGLLRRIGALRENTRRLFAATYTPQGLADELTLRYSLFENCLKRQEEAP